MMRASASQTFRSADLDRNVTEVERLDPQSRTRTLLWAHPAWLNIVRLDESGDNLLVESWPQNTLPKDASGDAVVLQILNRGSIRRDFKLNEFLAGIEEGQS